MQSLHVSVSFTSPVVLSHYCLPQSLPLCFVSFCFYFYFAISVVCVFVLFFYSPSVTEFFYLLALYKIDDISLTEEMQKNKNKRTEKVLMK